MTKEETQEARLSHKLLTTYKQDREQWLTDRIAEEKFAYGEQWTKKQAETLKSRGQVTNIFNRTLPHVKHQRSMLTSRTPEAQIISAGKSEPEIVSLLTQLLKYILYGSYWGVQYRRVINSMLMKSMGWIWVHEDPYSSEGRGDIKVEYVNIQDVYVPANSSGIFFDDAPSLILSRVVSLETAKQFYQDFGISSKDWDRVKISADQDTKYEGTDTYAAHERQEQIGPQSGTGVEEVENVRIIQRFVKEKKRVTRIVNSATNETREIEGNVKDEDIDRLTEVASSFIRSQVRVITTAGEDLYITDEVLPIEHFPLIPFVYEDVENPYPLGAVTTTKDIQILINKFVALVLLNIQLQSAMRLLYEEGSIKDKDLDRWALPGAKIPFARGRTPPIVVQTTAISQGMFSMLEKLESEFSFETGTFEFHQGSQAGMPNTYSQTLAAQEQTVQRLSPIVANVDASIQRMYEVVLQLIPTVYSEYRMLPIVDEDSGMLSTFEVNRPESPQSEMLDILTDVTKFKAFVRVKTGSTIEPSRTAYLSLMMQMASQDPVFSKYAIELMDVPFRKQLIQEMDENAKLKQMAEEYEQQVKQLENFIDSLDRSIMEKDRKVELAEFRATLEIQARDHKAALVEMRARAQARQETQSKKES